MLAENVRLQVKVIRSKAIKDKICIMFYCKLSASYQLYKDLTRVTSLGICCVLFTGKMKNKNLEK